MNFSGESGDAARANGDSASGWEASPLYPRPLNRRFWPAMAAFGALAAAAGFTLDGNFRLVVWVFLGGLALKTWIARAQHMQEMREMRERDKLEANGEIDAGNGAEK